MDKTYRDLRRSADCLANGLGTLRSIDLDAVFQPDKLGEFRVPFAVIEEVGQHRADAVLGSAVVLGKNA